MSLKINIAANYGSQIYVIVISIFVIPFYLTAMGPEAFGLIGFFTMMSAWFLLLDIGLTPTVSREVARFQGGAITAGLLVGIFRYLEYLFVAIGLAAMAGLLLFADRIATDWLNADQLPSRQVQGAVALMAIIIPLRWISGLYRAAIVGFDRQVWLALFSVIVATARFAGVLAAFALVGSTPLVFFGYQLAVAVAEVAILFMFARRLLPSGCGGLRPAGRELRSILRFSASVAFTGTVWILITQVDKLLLSTLLPLADYGYFTIAILLAAGINTMGAPITQAVLPRLTRLAAEQDETALVALYRGTTQLVCVIVAPIALCMAALSGPIIWAWTGDAEAVRNAAPTLSLYALGNGVMAVGALGYYLQYAKGDLRLHVIGNILMPIVLIPLLIWATRQYGAVGAGAAWLFSMSLYFLAWMPLIHRRLQPGLHWPWLTRDILPIIGVPAIGAAGLGQLIIMPAGRLEAALLATAAGGVLLLSALAGSSEVRQMLASRSRRLLHWRDRSA